MVNIIYILNKIFKNMILKYIFFLKFLLKKNKYLKTFKIYILYILF